MEAIVHRKVRLCMDWAGSKWLPIQMVKVQLKCSSMKRVEEYEKFTESNRLIKGPTFRFSLNSLQTFSMTMFVLQGVNVYTPLTSRLLDLL